MTVVIVTFVYYTPKMMTDKELPIPFYVGFVCFYYMVYQVKIFNSLQTILFLNLIKKIPFWLMNIVDMTFFDKFLKN